MGKVQDTVPVYHEITNDSNSLTNSWVPWHTSIHRNVQHLNYIPNPHLVLNPDFNWSRTKGNTPTTADGEFVEKWFVKANGMTFSITPTYYTSTTNSSDSGSERFVNVDITIVNSSPFILYQTFGNKLSKFQDKQLTYSARVFNNNSDVVKCKFQVGFDTNNDTTIDVTDESTVHYIQPGPNDIVMRVDTSKITADNQNNTVYLQFVLFDLTVAIDLDVFFIKPEFATDSTPLLVDHILEKVLIDNA